MKNQARFYGAKNGQQPWVLVLHGFIGAIIGVLVLHPLTTMVYWFEFRELMEFPGGGPLDFLVQRLTTAYKTELMPMSLVFAAIGGAIGFGFGLYHIRLLGQQRIVRYLERELAEELPLLIARGEGEHLEFKTSLRWDDRQQRANRELEQVVVKTVAGFLNHEGGTLLIGVGDSGDIVGIEPDFQTLKHANRDGFERALMDAVKAGLGGNACALVHCRFHDLAGKTVCRIIIERSVQPVYYVDGRVARLMLRAGNSTRELDVREAQAYLAHRFAADV
jgi:hypothetical protein|tara:strand:- start:20447 stop:21277 length:831 start_codon:yes stop_codon:yes gene_type:complete